MQEKYEAPFLTIFHLLVGSLFFPNKPNQSYLPTLVVVTTVLWSNCYLSAIDNCNHCVVFPFSDRFEQNAFFFNQVE